MNQGHPRAKAREELHKLNRHRPAAQDDERFGQPAEREGCVAGQAADLRKLWQRRRLDDGAGGDDKVLRRQPFAGAEFERMRIREPGHSPKELELAALKLLPAVIRKVLDERILARHDLGEIEPDVLGTNAPRLRMDAKPADLLAALDYHRLQPLGGGCPRRRIAAAAATDDGEVVIEVWLWSAHAAKMRHPSQAGKRGGGER